MTVLLERGKSSFKVTPPERHQVLDVVKPILKMAVVIFVAEKILFCTKTRQFPLQPSKKPSGSPIEPFQRGEEGNAGPHAAHNDLARRETHNDGLGRGRWYKRRKKNGSNS